MVKPSIAGESPANGRQKKAASRETAFSNLRQYVVPGPLNPPAKPYLKVFFICIVAEVLLKGYVYCHRNSQKTHLL